MKSCDIKFLLSKYRNEGLKGKQIYSRLKNIFEFESYVKFAKRYLR